jgi:Acetyltransferase (GNAT) domain
MNKLESENPIRILKTGAEIEAIRDFWQSCPSHRDADIDFFHFFTELSPEVLRPHVIVCYKDDVPEAMLAGRIEETHLPVKLGYFRIAAPKLKVLTIVHGGWLGNISEETAKHLIGSVVQSLAHREADAALLHCPDLASPLVRHAKLVPRPWCVDYLITPQHHRVRDLPAAPGDVLASLSQNERYQQRKRARKLAQEFQGVRIEQFGEPKDVDQLIRDAETVAQGSYQRGLGVGFADTALVRSRLEFEARKGWLRAYVLYLSEKPAALWIGSLRQGVFLSDYLAFDQAYAKHAPGMFLIIKVMEKLRADPDCGLKLRIDFGIGDATYKERLATSDWQESPVYIFASRPKAVWVNALRTGMGALNQGAKSLLRMTPLFAKIKQRLRTKGVASK